jgi:hypothetical protein
MTAKKTAKITNGYGHRRSSVEHELRAEYGRTRTDGRARCTRGLQNRLWSSVDVHSSSLLFTGVRRVGK